MKRIWLAAIVALLAAPVLSVAYTAAHGTPNAVATPPCPCRIDIMP